jgi:hypothetical protein
MKDAIQIKMSTFFLLLPCLLPLLGCAGARTGPLVPNEPAVTFIRSTGFFRPFSRAIFKADPHRPSEVRQIAHTGFSVGTQAVHSSGDWIAYTDAATGGLFVQDWRGVVTQRVPDARISSLDWTLGGDRIAFADQNRIWVLNLGFGSSPFPITTVPTQTSGPLAGAPAWAPDGSRIFFLSATTGIDVAGNPRIENQQILSVAADGTDSRVIYSGSPHPTWQRLAVTRDNSAVIFTVGDLRPSLMRLELATGSTSVLLDNAKLPALSRSGRRLAFIRDNEVWICQFDGSRCSEETRIGQGDTPTWSGL